MLSDGRVMEWADTPVKGVVDGLRWMVEVEERERLFALQVDFAFSGVLGRRCPHSPR
jgi:hypothetical protein